MDILAFDNGILDYIHENIVSPALDWLMIFLTSTSDKGAIWIALTLLCLIFKKTRKAGFCMAMALAVGMLFGGVFLKEIVSRTRPFVDNGVQIAISIPFGKSFPSGHTMSAFLTAFSLFLHYKAAGTAALIFASAVGFSRLYFYVHYPTDVIGGMVFGIIIAIIMKPLSEKLYAYILSFAERKRKMNKHFALIGHPLGHSMSPIIHEQLFAASGNNDCDYKLMDIPNEEFKAHFEELKKLSGFNITIPYKVDIIPFCDELAESAEECKSVNCVAFENGRAIGHNTDVYGFTKAIENLGASLSGNTLVLGMGGVARMVTKKIISCGGKLTIAIRKEDWEITHSALEELFGDYAKQIPVYLLTEIKGDYDLIVNCTPVGMFPNTDASPLSDEVLENITAKYFFDLIYNPEETLLLKKLTAKGAKASSGMDMLVLQAARAQEIWHGCSFTTEQTDKIIKKVKECL